MAPTTETVTKEVMAKWGSLLGELHAALSGTTDRPRSIAAILRDLETIRLTVPGLHRPCAFLAEWTCIPSASNAPVTPLEIQRREWVELGWPAPTEADKKRIVAEKLAQDRLRILQAEDKVRQAANDKARAEYVPI